MSGSRNSARSQKKSMAMAAANRKASFSRRSLGSKRALSFTSLARLANRNFSIINTTKERVPALPFLHLKESVLGKNYELSLVISGDALARRLNRNYRGKTYTPNVLAFPIGQKRGEIFLNLKQARRECAKRQESYRYFVALLFVHALLHLKGYRHSRTMEDKEVKLLSKFHITNT